MAISAVVGGIPNARVKNQPIKLPGQGRTTLTPTPLTAGFGLPGVGTKELLPPGIIGAMPKVAAAPSATQLPLTLPEGGINFETPTSTQALIPGFGIPGGASLPSAAPEQPPQAISGIPAPTPSTQALIPGFGVGAGLPGAAPKQPPQPPTAPVTPIGAAPAEPTPAVPAKPGISPFSLGLMAAGLSMMAEGGRSRPIEEARSGLGIAGQAGLAGLGVYTEAVKQEREAAKAGKLVNLRDRITGEVRAYGSDTDEYRQALASGNFEVATAHRPIAAPTTQKALEDFTASNTALNPAGVAFRELPVTQREKVYQAFIEQQKVVRQSSRPTFRMAAGIPGVVFNSRTGGFQDTQGNQLDSTEVMSQYLQNFRDRRAAIAETSAKSVQANKAADVLAKERDDIISLHAEVHENLPLPTGIKSLESLQQWLRNQTSNPAAARLLAKTKTIAESMQTVYGGSQGGQWTFELAREILDPSLAPEAFRGVYDDHLQMLEETASSFANIGESISKRRHLSVGGVPGKVPAATGATWEQGADGVWRRK